MDHDIRPQDDLFGHVNGRWLAETEIPSDRSSWGPFVQLADVAEAQVREIIEGLAAVGPGLARRRPAQDPRPLRVVHGRGGDQPARPAPRAPAARRHRRAARHRATSRRSSASSSGSAATGCSAPTSTPTTATPTATSSTSCRAGSACPTSPTTATTSSPRCARSTSATSPPCSASPSTPTRPAPRRRSSAIDTRLAQGHWERAETRDVQKTYNLMTGAELRELCPAFDWDAWVTNLSGAGIDTDPLLAEVCVRQPSYLAHLSTVLEEVPIEDWRQWLQSHVLRAAAAYLTDDFVAVNFDFYGRTLNGTPELRARWKRGVSLVEGAIGEAVGREYVARHFPPESKAQMDALVANLLEAYRRSIADLDWMTEETKQRAYEKLDTFRPKIGYPDEFRDYSALVVTPGRPARQRRRLVGVRDRPPAAQDRLAGRPRRVVHAAADRQRLLQPRHQRDLLPGRHPAAAVLQPRRRPGRELRRHRRRDRPRDRARLRRPGRAVRRAGQPRRLVDARRQGRVRGEVEGAWSSSTTASSRARCPASTSTAS